MEKSSIHIRPEKFIKAGILNLNFYHDYKELYLLMLENYNMFHSY